MAPPVRNGLTHLDARGHARMVDVGEKAETARQAVAVAFVRMRPATLRALKEGDTPKGDVLAVARVAGIQAAKRTPELIPMCHHVKLTSVKVELLPLGKDRVRIEARASALDRTGVEMEALTAASVAALTLYDMLKAIDKGMVIEQVALLEKRGGKSGDFVAQVAPSRSAPSGGRAKSRSAPSGGRAKSRSAPSGGRAKSRSAPSGGRAKSRSAPSGGRA